MACGTERPIRDIRNVPNEEFVPNTDNTNSLMESFIFHVMKSLVKFLPCFNNFKSCIPPYIWHPHIQETSKKSEYDILDLLDKSENKSDDMLTILQEIHKFIPCLNIYDEKNVLERITFGGDVLTNERAYTGQVNMVNVNSESGRMQGVIHRPEGLHMCMNLCKYMVETFCSTSSASDAGTLYNLSVLVDRSRDMGLDVTKQYTSSVNFIQDALDGHIVASCMKILNMSSVDSRTVCVQSIENENNNVKLDYMQKNSKDIIHTFVFNKKIPCPAETMEQVTEKSKLLKQTDKDGGYRCPFKGCTKMYSSNGWLKSHLKKIHGVLIELAAPSLPEPARENEDGKLAYASAFMKVALLLRDTIYCYRMGDGDRLFRNIKFLLLHFDHGKHTKYRIWSFRMLAYVNALLSETEAYAYKWNISVNLTGKTRQCIANDHLVEINVHKVKESIRAMGANITYPAVRRSAKCIQPVSTLTDIFAKPVSGKHTTANTTQDVTEIAHSLNGHNIFSQQAGREHRTFSGFSPDLLLNVDMNHLCKWLDGQKMRIYSEMQLYFQLK